MLNTFTPDFYVDYLRDLRDLEASGEMTSEAILAVMARYATYPAGTRAGVLARRRPAVTVDDLDGTRCQRGNRLAIDDDKHRLKGTT